jgi:hypothetical protein
MRRNLERLTSPATRRTTHSVMAVRVPVRTAMPTFTATSRPILLWPRDHRYAAAATATTHRIPRWAGIDAACSRQAPVYS